MRLLIVEDKRELLGTVLGGGDRPWRLVLQEGLTAERPDGGNQSFPSGHTSISFSAAEFVRKRYGWEYGVPLYAAAAFVGYSRVEARRHYVQDVIAGGAIGIAGSYVFTSPFHGWHIRMQAADGCYGLVAARPW